MPMTGIAVGAIAAPVVGGIVGNIMGSGARDAANAAAARAYHEYDNVNIPEIQKQELALKSPEVQGILAPYLEQAQKLGSSQMQGIQTDPRLQQAQMSALDTLSKMGAQGLTAEDRASLNAARRQVSGDAEARQKSIMQQMAQRGIGGSGVELANRLASNQQATDEAGQQSDRTMAMAQQRMLQAISQAGQLGGQMRSQDFGEQSAKAQAADTIAQFNAQQAAAVQARNAGASNTAQGKNLAEQQRIADTGVATSNAQQEHNKGLIEQKFNNEMALASARANAGIGQANALNNQAQQTQSLYGGIGAGVGQGLMGAYALSNRPTTGFSGGGASSPLTPDSAKFGNRLIP